MTRGSNCTSARWRGMSKHLLPLAASLALVACDQSPAPAERATVDPAPAESAEPTATAIPAALQGRWGLTENDCDPAQDFAAKGLVEVSDTTMKFYESLATLGEVTNSSDTSIEADFAFTGEGMEWSRHMTLTAEGDTLVRAESGEDAEFAALTYTRCAG